ncbi:hypothetical protein L7F22_049158 [Adiantum nelumboides]|nr:hypothetical protein [Adiantum nelumboides]
MGPLPRTANGKLYILVAIDYMTRWVEAQSVAKVNEKTVSKFVYTHICCRFGTSLEIVSDNGPGFRRGLLTEVCEELKISHRHSTPYYPQSNGLVEKANGIIAGIIRKMVESKPKRWDNFLDGAIWAYKTTYRDATQFTPFHLVYGQEALQPIELNIPTIKLTGRHEQSNDEAWIDRLLNLVELEWKREAAYHCYKKKALQLKDKLNEGIKDKEIKEKSLVLRYNNALDNMFDAKFERRWEGPFIVQKAFTGGYYQLMDLNGKEHPRKVNGYRLKPYLSRILPAVFETKQVSKKTKKACKACQQAGDRKLSYGPRFPIFAYGPFEKWGIDAIGPLPRTSTGKQYILTATDYMTRWTEAASVARITAADVSRFVLDYICSRFGTPLEILSDRDPGFRADLLDALLENLSIKHIHSTPYYPQCNGLVEKTNGVLCKIITKHVRDRPQDWDKHLTAALWAYRTSFKVSTQFTPYHLVYGQEALLPIEVELGSLRVLARETTSSKEKLEQRILDLQRLELDREAATDYYITQANKKREQFNNKVKEKKLEERMLVMRYDSRLDLSHSKKFLQRWEGPYVIFKKFKNGSYRLQDLSGNIHKYPVNGWRLKEFFQCIQPIKEERQVSLDA